MGTRFATPDTPKGFPQSSLAGWVGREESKNIRPSVKKVQEVLQRYADVSMLVTLDIADVQKNVGDNPEAVADSLEFLLKDRVAKRGPKTNERIIRRDQALAEVIRALRGKPETVH